MSQKQPERKSLVLNINEVAALGCAIDSLMLEHPFHTLDERTGAVDWSAYNPATTALLNRGGLLKTGLTAIGFSEQIIRVSDQSLMVAAKDTLEWFLRDATEKEIERHDVARNPTPPEPITTTLRGVFVRITDCEGNRRKFDPETALGLGIVDLISYRGIWQYAVSDYEREQTDPEWATLHRQALHLLQLRSYQEEK
jgi:hypothetical protein